MVKFIVLLDQPYHFFSNSFDILLDSMHGASSRGTKINLHTSILIVMLLVSRSINIFFSYIKRHTISSHGIPLQASHRWRDAECSATTKGISLSMVILKAT